MNLKTKLNSALHGKKLTIFPFFGILALTFLVNNFLIEQYLPNTEKYTDAEIRYEPVRDVDIGKYIVREGSNRFLFAAETLDDLYLSLKFISPANLTVELEPSYEDSGCSDGGVNEARISFSGDDISQTFPLLLGRASEFNHVVSKDQIISIAVSNRYFKECGKVLVSFIQNNKSGSAALSFGLVWLLIFLVCLSIRTSTSVALLGATFNALFIWAEATLGSLSSIAINISITLSIGFAGLVFLFTALPFRSKLLAALFSIIVIAIFLLPIAVIGHDLIFRAPINEESIHAILQSYLGQTIEFWGQFVGLKNTLYGLIGMLFVYLLTLRLNHFKFKKVFSASIGLAFLCIASIQIIDRWHDSSVFRLIDKAVKIYRFEINSFQAISSQRKQHTIEAVLDPTFENNTTVFVIGESVNRSHMSAYGYLKKTTPMIDQRIIDGNVIKFSSVFSNHTHSNPTLSFLLTQANQYNDKKWVESPSILNLTNALSIKSTWLTNHRLLGGWSNHITAIAQDANLVKTINNKVGKGNSASRFDGALLPLWREAIAEQPNQASFLHFYNSHIDYCSRYPESADVFDDQVTRAYYGEWTDNRKVGSDGLNCYDNSIYYTDVLLEEIIQDLDSRSRPSILVYIPDHSDDVLQARFHNAVMFTHAMTTVPLFVWANQEWRQQHPNLWQNLINNKDIAFTNDFLFESMSGLLGISESTINKSYDFSSEQFNPPRVLKTIHGRRNIKAPENWRYWQTFNSQKLIDQNYRLGATNIDSVAKASIALNTGFELLQVNVAYSGEDDFQVCDEDFEPIGIDLKTFFHAIDQPELNAISIRVTNPQQFGEAEIREKLDNVIADFPKTVIIEDSNTTNFAVPKLAQTDLFQQTNVIQHDKADILMLDLTTQFDKLEPIITEN